MTYQTNANDIECEDFYNICQYYRHAKDNGDACRAYEELKQYIARLVNTSPPQPQTVADALEEAAKICDEYYSTWCSKEIRNLITTQPTQVQSDWMPKLGDLVHPSKNVCEKYTEWKADELLKIVGINYKRSSMAFGKYTDVIDLTIVEVSNDYGATDGWKLEDVTPAAPSIQGNTE